MNELALLLAATLNAGTVLAIAGLGLLINERSGIINLGAEGLMLVAAIAGFATAVQHRLRPAGLRCRRWRRARCWPPLFGLLVIWLNTNQYATGLALSLFGTGFSAFVGIRVHPGSACPTGMKFDRARAEPTSACSGRRCSSTTRWSTWRDALALGLALVPVPLARRPGAARGGRVARVRPCAGLPGAAHPPGGGDHAGGALCGLAGAYLSVIYTPLWVEGMVAGKGWIALALTTFATWRPARVLLGAYLFGGVTMLQFHLQGEGVEISSQWLTMLPYLATIVVLVLISRNPTWIRVNMPASLGKPFFPGH